MSILFNGTSSKAVYSGTAFVAGHPITLFAWVKVNAAGMSSARRPVTYGQADATEVSGIYCDGTGSHKMVLQAKAGSSITVSSTSSTVQDTWMPVMYVLNSSVDRKLYYGSGAVVSSTGSADTQPQSADRYVLGAWVTDTNFFSGELAECAIWNTALSQGNFDSLAAGALPETVQTANLVELFKLLDSTDLTGVNGSVLTGTALANGGTHPITRSSPCETAINATTANAFGTISSNCSTPCTTAINATTANAFGTISSNCSTPCTTAINATTANAVGAIASVSSTASNTITTPPLKNNTGTLLTGETGITVNVYHMTTGALIVHKTGQTSHGTTGVVVVTDALITPATQYRVVVILADGSDGLDKITAT